MGRGGRTQALPKWILYMLFGADDIPFWKTNQACVSSAICRIYCLEIRFSQGTMFRQQHIPAYIRLRVHGSSQPRDGFVVTNRFNPLISPGAVSVSTQIRPIWRLHDHLSPWELPFKPKRVLHPHNSHHGQGWWVRCLAIVGITRYIHTI